MRVTLFLFVTWLIIGLFLWVNLSSASLVFGSLIWVAILVISAGYADKVVLYLFGAREVRSSDQEDFFEAALHEAYKLSVPAPKLYYYNGTLERAFVLQNRHDISIILNRSLLEKCTQLELNAVCFELLLQVKKGMAVKRTRVMFLLGLISWILHSLIGIILLAIPVKEVKQATGWFVSYFLHPWLNFLFRLLLGYYYFKKLGVLLNDFPKEKDLLSRVGLKLRKPHSYNSLPSRKLLELTSSHKSRHFQRIMALEFLPHEWDILFIHEELASAE